MTVWLFFTEDTEQERPEDQIPKHLKNALRFLKNEKATSWMEALKRAAAASANIYVLVMEVLTEFTFLQDVEQWQDSMEPTTSLRPTQVQRWLRSDPPDLRALLNALQQLRRSDTVETKKETLSRANTHIHSEPHTHTHNHTHTHPLLPSLPFSPSPSLVAGKLTIWAKLGVPYKNGPRSLRKGANMRQTSAATLWKLQELLWLSRKFGWLVRPCRTEVRRPAGRETRVETCDGKPPLWENYRKFYESMLLR